LLTRSRQAFRGLTAAAEAYAIALYDPLFGDWASTPQRGREPFYVSDDGCLVLGLEPQDDDPGVLIGRVRTDIGEVQVESEQDPAFAAHSRSNRRIVTTLQTLIPNGLGLETAPAERSSGLGG
jgi:hypothetical protein